MGRRGQVLLTVTAFVAGAGMVAALVVLPNAWQRHEGPPSGGRLPGAVALEPVLLRPRLPGATITPLAPGGTPATGNGSARPAGKPSGNAPAGHLGVNVGSVEGLYPGRRVELEVRYVNPYSFPISIETVRVNATGTARCTAAQLMPTPTPRLRIPSRSSIASTIEVGMRRTAPDACQGVRFAVRVRVTAVQL